MTKDLEAEYNNRGRVPEHPQIFARMDRDAAAYRAATPQAEMGLAYGPSPRQFIDLFPGKTGGTSPLAVFIHGGYWRTQHPVSYSHLAANLNARGVSVGIAGYDLCPQVSVATIIDQLRAACLFLWRKRKQRMLVFGHSAGGHLTACMVATDWKKLEADAPADLAAAGYAISGVFDLTPLVGLSQNVELRLDAAEAKRVSPVFWPAPKGLVLDAVVGGAESSEFLRQSHLIVGAWGGQAQTRYEAIAGANHFTVLDPLDDANSRMVARLVELAEQVEAKKP